jgi:IS5 family transposase
LDQDSGLVRRAILTPGHVSDKLPFLDLVQGDERAVYADKGYDGTWYRARLAEQGIADGVMAGDYRQRRLDAAGLDRNRLLGAIRRPIERTFGVLKRWYGYGRVQPHAQRPAPATARRRPQPAPRPGADRLRADSAAALTAPAVMTASKPPSSPTP